LFARGIDGGDDYRSTNQTCIGFGWVQYTGAGNGIQIEVCVCVGQPSTIERLVVYLMLDTQHQRLRRNYQ
jgi:hypothetical protein